LTAAVNCVKKTCFFSRGVRKKKRPSANVTVAMGKPIRGGCTSEKKKSVQPAYFDLVSLWVWDVSLLESPVIDFGGLTGQVKTYSYEIRRYFKQLNLNK